MLKWIFNVCFVLFLPIYQFFARQGKTALVFVVDYVFEIHCSTEGPYIYFYVWGTEIR